MVLVSSLEHLNRRPVVVTPDLGTDRICPGNSDMVTPATKTVDEHISSINPHPDLKAATVVPQ